MHRDILIAVAAGLFSASLALNGGSGSPLGTLLSLTAPLPILLAGLGIGLGASVIAGVAGVGALLIGADVSKALVYVVSDAAPCIFLIRFALLNRTGDDGEIYWYPAGRLLAFLTLYCAAAFVILAIYVGIEPGGLQGKVAAYVDALRRILPDDRQNTPAVERLLATIKQILPFIMVAWWMVILVVNALGAQKLLVWRGHNLRPGPGFGFVELPRWLLPALVVAAAGALLGSGSLGYIAENLTLILGVPYFLTGLVIAHAISVRWKGRAAILFALYLFLVLFGWPVLLVACIGVTDQWLNLRSRFAAPGPGNERNE
jgi:hypothetical protein